MESSYKFALSKKEKKEKKGKKKKKKSCVALKKCTQIIMVKNRKKYQEEVTDPQLL